MPRACAVSLGMQKFSEATEAGWCARRQIGGISVISNQQNPISEAVALDSADIRSA